MMSILPPSNTFLVLVTRCATFLLRLYITSKLCINIQLDEVDSGVAWRSRLLTMEWNDQGCVVGGTTVGGRSATFVRLQLCVA